MKHFFCTGKAVAATFLLLVLFGCASYEIPLAEAKPDAVLSHREEKLADGVTLSLQQYKELFGAPQHLAVLKIDWRKNPDLKLDFKLCGDRRKTVAEFARETPGALAVINAGFFAFSKPPRSAWGRRIGGKVVNAFRSPSPARVVLSFDGSGRAVSIHPMEKAGDYLPERDPAPEAVESWPLLLHQGESRDYSKDKYLRLRNPRTAVGVTDEGVTFWVVVDGRMPEARGLSAKDLANLMRQFGCVDAINLDGGGSSAMWVDPLGVVSHPCDNKSFDTKGSRRVNDAIILSRGSGR
ncbi:MAG: phosphodiester glycosidase family protein [Victivallaceae bacterium]|nr:phosphodiester glycosidase family protein [Victivallaceae bacterium]